MKTANDAATAYSYVRFSNKEQSQGDSLRRQTEKAETYCQRHGWTLDASLSLRDLGVSAFRGKNALVGNLGVFLEAVKRGTVPKGSVLIVESIDRISRQGIDEGYDLIKGILKAGIRLVTLSPEREFDAGAVKSLSKGALEIQLILERAAEESERKSDRVGAAWTRKKGAARQGTIMSERLPAWVTKEGGKLVLVPAAAAAVRLIFELAASGYGIPSMLRKLTEDGVQPIGRTGRWNRSYVCKILGDRRATGELQPRQGKGKDGAPIAGYYPAVVSEADWLRARAGIDQRTRYRGRVSAKQVNVFSGLLRDARDGCTYIMTTRLSRTKKKQTTRRFQVLVNTNGDEGTAGGYSIPYDVIEGAVCSLLREINPRDIMATEEGPDETLALAEELKGIEARIAKVQAQLTEGDDEVGPLMDVLRSLNTKHAARAAELVEARQKTAHPLGEAWADVRSLAEALADAPDPEDARRRLRSALRRIVVDCWLLVVRRDRDRLSAVQINFAGGGTRHYLIHSWSAGFHRPGGWTARSFTDDAAAGLDLSQRKDAAELEAFLEAADLGGFTNPGA